MELAGADVGPVIAPSRCPHLEVAGDPPAVDEEILRRGLEELRRTSQADPRTLDAFEQVIFQRRRPADVATDLDMTANDVYLAKHRCLKRLRTIVAGLNELYEVPPE